jgi:flagellar hook-length control protein FliK
MTNQTNLDYLFKLTSPLPERNEAGLTPPSGRRPAFDDHLVNASASSNSAGIDMRSADSAGQASRRKFDDDRSRTNDQAISAASDAKTKPAEDPHDSAEPNIHGADGKSASDVAANEGESNSDQDAAEELAAAALNAGQRAGESHEKLTLEDQVGEAAKRGDKSLAATLSNLEGGTNRGAGDVSARQLRAAELAGEAATPNLEADQNTPASASKKAKRSKSAEGAAADSKSQNDATDKGHDADGATAEVTPNMEHAALSAKAIAEKSAIAGRRSARQTPKTADDSARGADSSTTQRTDANVAHDQASSVAVANGVSAQSANSIAKAEPGEEARQAVKPVGHATEGLHLTGRAHRAAATAKGRALAASPDLPHVDAARFVGRVAKAVQTAQERGGLVQLRLSPPELGSLRLELSMQNGVMTAAVETETPAARQILLDHLPALRDRLAEQNIRVERFDVDVRQENSGGQADPRSSQQERRQQQPQQPNSRHPAGRSAATQAPTDDAPHALTRLTNSELNVLA